MMRRFLFASLVATTLMIGGSASAQQRPSPLPTGNGNSALKPENKLPPLRFPTTAATYEQYVQYWLKLVRTATTKYRVSQGDANKVVLHLKDCASRVEADGYVTRAEANYCRTTTMSMVHEIATPYMMQAAGDGAH